MSITVTLVEELTTAVQQVKASSLTSLDVEKLTIFNIHPQTYINKFQESLWEEVGTENPLKKSFFISYRALKTFRYLALLINIITVVLTFINESMCSPPQYLFLSAFLTYWGLGFCLIHSVLVLVWADAPDHSFKWKVVYLLGEIAFTLETLICPFFMFILLPIFLTTVQVTAWDIFFQLMTHLVVPSLIYAETVFNNVSFNKSHRTIIGVLMIFYCINNYGWVLSMGKPVYPPINWISTGSHCCIVISAALLVGGFALGGIIHNMKKGRRYFKLVAEEAML